MPLRIKCPTGHTLIVPDDRAGRTLRCPRCSEPVVVPGGVGQLAASASREAQAAEVGAGTATTTTAPAVTGSCVKNRPPPLKSRPVVKPKSRALPAREPSPPPVDLKSLPPTKPEPPVVASPRVEAPAVELPVAELAVGDLPVATFAPEPPPIVAQQPPIIVSATLPALPPPPIAVAETLPAPPPLAQRKPEPATKAEQPIAAEPVPPKNEGPEEKIVAPVAAVAPVANLAPEPTAQVSADSSYDDQPDENQAHAEPIEPPHPVPPPAVVPSGPAPVTISLAADTAKVLVVYQLAAALVVAALFSLAPAVWDVVEYVQFLDAVDSPSVARWALVLFFLGVIQLAYAVYLFQLPDWTTVWVVTMYSLLMAAVYAGTLGLVLLSGGDGWIVGEHGLQLADKLAGGKAALWCLCMVSVSTILAFFSGRLSVRWRRAEMMLREAGV